MKKNYLGGYFSLELNIKDELHKNALHLNSGRSCLNYLLKKNIYKKIFLPYYSCDSLLDVIKENNLEYTFYSLNELLLPEFKKELADDEVFLFINYYSLHSNILDDIVREFKNVIVDNSQAFYSLPQKNIDTFYSSRKFFGVADGGYLYTDISHKENLERDYSTERSTALLLRSEGRLEEGYKVFQENEKDFTSYGIRQMSELTQNILSSIDYANVKNKRNKNFEILYRALQNKNRLNINTVPEGPMVYPFFIEDGKNIKKYLIHKKVFCATYWIEVLDRVRTDSLECQLVNDLIPLPIDQRYNTEDMLGIVKMINEYE